MTASHLSVFNPASQNDLSQSATSNRQSKISASNQIDPFKRSAWLREMERAQISTWFKTFDANPPSNPPVPSPLHQGAPYFAKDPFKQQSHNGETSNAEINSGDKTERLQQNTDASTSLEIKNSINSADDERLIHNASQHFYGMSKLSEDPPIDRPSSVQVHTSENSQHTLNRPLIIAIQQNLFPEIKPTDILKPVSLLELSTDQSFDEIHFLSSSEKKPIQAEILHAAQTILVSADGRNAPPIRVHAKWESNKLTLWLGMDGSTTQIASQAATVISELRRYLSSQGMSLERVICNGTVIFDLTEAIPFKSVVPFAQVLQQYTQQPLSSELQPDLMSSLRPHDLPISLASPFTQSKETS